MTAGRQKAALVTGSARRIGRVIALALADRGWDIGVHYRHSETEAFETVREIEAMGRRAVALRCDLRDEAAVSQLLPQAVEALGKVSCVVNNAAIFEHDNVEKFSGGGLDAHMRTNLAAPILLARALYDLTPPREQSVVINLLDQKLDNLNPSFLSYTLSKAALATATKMLAQELAPKLRVVGISPGLTLLSANMSEEEFALAHTVTPLGRSSTPEDIAATVCFIVESRAITGTTIMVDGGQHLIPLRQDVMFVAKINAPEKET